MYEHDLTPEARGRLWQCYSMLLKLAEEADEDTSKKTEPGEVYESARTTNVNNLTQLKNDSANE